MIKRVMCNEQEFDVLSSKYHKSIKMFYQCVKSIDNQQDDDEYDDNNDDDCKFTKNNRRLHVVSWNDVKSFHEMLCKSLSKERAC